MNYEIVEINGFKIVGKEVETSNSENKFMEVWDDFLRTYTTGQIIGLYTDYENNFLGDFTFVVGVVSEEKEFTREIKSGKYAKFTVNSREKVLDVWQYIWQNDLNRKYLTDFEKYNEDGSVEIFVSVV